MKTKLYGIFLALLGAFVLTSCEDDDGLNLSDIPDPVLSSFESKYPSATYVEWEMRGGYFVAELWYDGAELDVWYKEDGSWAMTETDMGVGLLSLPDAVLTSFMKSQYSEWYIDDTDKYERPGELFYRLEIQTVGQPERNLFYKEDGTLIKDEIDRENDGVTPDTKL